MLWTYIEFNLQYHNQCLTQSFPDCQKHLFSVTCDDLTPITPSCSRSLCGNQLWCSLSVIERKRVAAKEIIPQQISTTNFVASVLCAGIFDWCCSGAYAIIGLCIRNIPFGSVVSVRRMHSTRICIAADCIIPIQSQISHCLRFHLAILEQTCSNPNTTGCGLYLRLIQSPRWPIDVLTWNNDFGNGLGVLNCKDY